MSADNRPSLSAGQAPSEPLSLPHLPSVSDRAEQSAGNSAGRSRSIPGTPSLRWGASFGGDPGSFGGRTPSGLYSDRYGTTSRRREYSIPRASLSEAERSAWLDEEDQEENATFVWGTNVSSQTVRQRARRFLTGYREPDVLEAKYVELIRQAAQDTEPNLNVDCTNLYDFDNMLYRQLVNYPGEVLSIFDEEVRQILREMAREDWQSVNGEHELHTSPFNLKDTKVIRDLNPDDVDCLISVGGMVTRTSNVIPDLMRACFKCESCGHETIAANDRGRIAEPFRCPNEECKARFTQRLMHNLCTFCNKQIIKMQENPNAIPEGETPHSVTMLAFEELVDAAKPGDRITVTGIYTAAPLRVNPRQRAIKAVYKTFVRVMHVHRDQQSQLFSVARAAPTSEAAAAAAADEAMEGSQYSAPSTPGLPPEDIHDTEPLFQTTDMSREQVQARAQELEALSQVPDLYEKLTASIAPSIWQMDDVKKGILCQLFGAPGKEFAGGRVRGELNVLLVGDPGVSKSQLLTYVNKLSPRGLYTSGRGSSAVGLTAYVTKDAETREMVLESGALVLSDKGICCIDEFDKMSDSARSMLHEVMEQQTVSVAKAGIIATLNARTSVLASANPVGSRYNPRMSVIDNIHLPPSLLSRFDLIYLVLDKVDQATDVQLAKHLVSLYYEHRPAGMQAPVPVDVLRDYIAYARAKCFPELTEPAARKLVQSYKDMRAAGTSRKVITATPRQLESLVRLSEALARMRLSPTVQEDHVTEALRLMTVAMQQSATDPETGAIDMDIIQTGVSASRRRDREALANELAQLLLARGGGATVEELTALMAEQSSVNVTGKDVIEALSSIEGDIIREGQRIRHKHAAGR